MKQYFIPKGNQGIHAVRVVIGLRICLRHTHVISFGNVSPHVLNKEIPVVDLQHPIPLYTTFTCVFKPNYSDAESEEVLGRRRREERCCHAAGRPDHAGGHGESPRPGEGAGQPARAQRRIRKRTSVEKDPATSSGSARRAADGVRPDLREEEEDPGHNSWYVKSCASRSQIPMLLLLCHKHTTPATTLFHLYSSQQKININFQIVLVIHFIILLSHYLLSFVV